MTDMLCPGHLGDVHKTFHARFQFYKGAVICDTGNFTGSQRIDRISFLDTIPWEGLQLLVSKRYSFTLPVELENLDFDLVSDGEKV